MKAENAEYAGFTGVLRRGKVAGLNMLTAVHTDMGIEKTVNQDSLCLKTAQTTIGDILLAVVCDGMGGLACGEVASAALIKAFSNWFEQELPRQVRDFNFRNVQDQWMAIIQMQNEKIVQYGLEHAIQLGTTLTALLIVNGKEFLIAHVGDSSVYRIAQDIQMLTQKQTVSELERQRGVITDEQAKTDPRRNVLLQCIGASAMVQPSFVFGACGQGEVFVLCSDGLQKKLLDKELLANFSPAVLSGEAVMEKKAQEMVGLCKQRKETDNISVIVIKL